VAKRLKTKEEIEKYFRDFMAFTDCIEQPIPRPAKNRKKRRLYYSGKKKKHTRSQESVYSKSEGTDNLQNKT
jgi:hypothetical protein